MNKINDSLFMARLFGSGIGLIEGLYRSSHDLNDKLDEDECISISLSSLNGEYLGTFFVDSKKTDTEKTFIGTILDDKNGNPYYPSAHDELEVLVYLKPYDFDLYTGKFVADYGICTVNLFLKSPNITIEELYEEVPDQSIRGNKTRSLNGVKYAVSDFLVKNGLRKYHSNEKIMVMDLIRYINNYDGFEKATSDGMIKNFGKMSRDILRLALKPYKHLFDE